MRRTLLTTVATLALATSDGLGPPALAGGDDVHLRSPYGGFAVQGGETLYVSDTRNHRVLVVDSANRVKFRIPHPFPGAIELLGIQEVAVGSQDGPEPIVLYSHWDTGAPTGCIPIVSGHHAIRRHPSVPGRFWCTAADAYELDFNDFLGRYSAPPLNRGLWKAQDMTAGVDYYSAPVLDYFWAKKTLCLKASQAGTASVEIARFLHDNPLGWWDGGWETYDTFSLSANILNTYSRFSDVPLGVYRLKVSLKENGKIDGWIVQR